MARKRRKGIKINPANRGKLRKITKKTKRGTIKVADLVKLKKSKNPKTRKRANFALNARKWAKGRSRG